jgi:putative heme transporter
VPEHAPTEQRAKGRSEDAGAQAQGGDVQGPDVEVQGRGAGVAGPGTGGGQLASQPESGGQGQSGGQDEGAGEHHPSRDEMPRVVFTRRRLLASLLFVVSSIAFLYFVLPRLLGLKETWNRIQHGNGWWLALGALLEVCSFIGYIALFRAVFVRGKSRIDWRESYQITMSGLAATRLFASAGAGGIALTAWALRRSGMAPRIVACRMVAQLALLYGVYMATLVIVGLALFIGLIPGGGSFALTVVPALFGATVIALFLSVSLLPGDFDRLVKRWTKGSGRFGRAAARLATVPATAATGVRTAISLVRSRDVYLLGSVAWWGFDLAVLWACFHAFGASPPKGVIIMSYFVGMVGNTLPLPGGIGGVDGGMIGALTAFGVGVQVSVVSVLAYRVFSFWLPTLPGAIAYLQLRRTVQRWQEEPVGDTPGSGAGPGGGVLSEASGQAS